MNAPLIPGLGEELAAAAGRQHRRRRRRLQVAAAGSLVVVFAAAMAVTSTIDAPPASADLDITERDGRVEVRLTDVETRPDVVEDALRDADIDADVTAVPVSPSLVGRFVSFGSPEGGAATVEPLEGDGLTAPGFSIPAHYPGRLELGLGRPARAGEVYAAGGNALSAGEPLACLDLVGRPARALLDVAADHPDLRFDLRPMHPAAPPEAPVPMADLAASPYADWFVTYVTALAPDAVLVELTTDGRPPALNPLPPIVGC